MPFTVKDWRNATTSVGGGDESTPLTAAALEDLETRVTDYARTLPGFYNAKDYGLAMDAATDDGPALQSLINTITALPFGATILFPPGSCVLNTTVTVPVDSSIRLVGSGMGWWGTGQRITKLIRTSQNANPMIEAVGTGSSLPTERSNIEIRDMWIDGGFLIGGTGIGACGPLVSLYRSNQVLLDRVRFANNEGYGVLAQQFYNGAIRDCYWQNCGVQGTKGALVFSSAPSFGTNTVTCTNLEFEDNHGTDLHLTGSQVTAICAFANLKFEGDASSAVTDPYIHIEFAQDCDFTNVHIVNHRDVPAILCGSGGNASNRFANFSIVQGGGTSPTYQIKQTGGALMLSNGVLMGDVDTAHVHVDSTVGAGDFYASGIRCLDAAEVDDSDIFVDDDRTTADTTGFIREYPYGAKPTIASAATITIPQGIHFATVSGTADITAITASEVGHQVTLVFSGTAATTGVVDDGGALNLSANFGYTPNDSLTLICDGTNWREVARSVN